MDTYNIMDKIRRLRENKGWNELELSKKAGLTQSTISSLFRRNNLPTIPTLDAICKAFDITLAQFFNDYNSLDYLTEQQRQLLEQWELLKDEQKEALLNLMKKM